MIDKGIAWHDYPITDAAETVIGRVISGTQSPSLAKRLVWGYVATAHAGIGSEIRISVRTFAESQR